MDSVDKEDDVGDVAESVASHFVQECAYNTAVTSEEGELRTFQEMLKSKNAALWNLSAIAEINNFLYKGMDACKIIYG